MAQLYVGTSGWAYAGWKPEFYPAKLAAKKFLNYYATQLNTVEVNFTFRQLVKEATLAGWLADTPAAFRFGIKAHQRITHLKRLRDVGEFTDLFVRTIEPLAAAGRMGPVLFQLPPNMKCDGERLSSFLATLPESLPVAFEFRHVSWFRDEVYERLRAHRGGGATLCLAESEERETPEVVTGPLVYYRFRKPSYSAEERAAMVRKIRGHLAGGRDVYAYFKHEETPEGALYAVEMRKAVGA